MIQYPCFSSTARNLGASCLITFRNGFKYVAQPFHTSFRFVFNYSSELNGSPALPWYTFVFTRSQKKKSNGFTSSEERDHSTHLTKQRFKVFYKEILYQIRSMWRSTLLEKYPVIMLNKFFNCRKQLFFKCLQ